LFISRWQDSNLRTPTRPDFSEWTFEFCPCVTLLSMTLV